MTYISILFVPPLYFLSRKCWGSFFLNSCLYGLALLCVATIVAALIAPVFWILAVGHASFAYRKELLNQHADRIATKLAEKMNKA